MKNEIVSKYIQEIINKNNDASEIWKKQFLYNPSQEHDSYELDPLNEEDKSVRPHHNIIHKYPNKILILITNKCPVFCRFCTRKRNAFEENGISVPSADDINDYLDKNKNIHELIISGGDPFTVDSEKLYEFIKKVLSHSNQIKYLRYHTRCATTLPKFCINKYDTLEKLVEVFPMVTHSVVFHINHHLEITKETNEIFEKLLSFQYRLFSQTVLLKDINNCPNILKRLFEMLIKFKVQPYYLHQLDRAKGSKYFEVSIEEGLKIMEQLKLLLPSYFLPRYVRDSSRGKKNLFY